MSAKVGPHKKAIDWIRVDDFLMAQCTGDTVACFIGVSYDTLERRCKEHHKVKFAAYAEQKRSIGRQTLRKKMYDIAMAGDRTMLIWLSKQYLGFADKVQSDTSVKVEPLIIEDSAGSKSVYGLTTSVVKS